MSEANLGEYPEAQLLRGLLLWLSWKKIVVINQTKVMVNTGLTMYEKSPCVHVTPMTKSLEVLLLHTFSSGQLDQYQVTRVRHYRSSLLYLQILQN